MSITLYAGWNEVRYTGVTQSAEAAFASIEPYLMIAYYWNGSAWVTPTTLVTGNYYQIKVSQDCVWTFEMPMYTQIVDIVAPSTARAGELVPVTIKIKNLWTGYLEAWAVGVLDSVERFIDWQKYIIPPGETHSFSGSFTMPNRGVTIHAYSYYTGEDGYLYFDVEASKAVNLEVVPEPEFRGFEITSYA